MHMHEFHPSNLSRNDSFRDSLRFKEPFTTERLDRAQSILTSALEKHGEEHLTAKNFDKVMEHVRKDPGYHGLHSAGPALETALRQHLGIPSED